MPAYISLCTWTQKGIGNIKESPNRLEAAKKAFASAGGKLTGFYMTFGRHDFVVISEFPDDESAAKGLLSIASGGNFQSETLKAFAEADYKKIITGLP